MPYDEGLAHRIRETLGDRHGVTEKQMFGGIAFILDGNMVCGVIDDSLMARVGPDAYEDVLDEILDDPEVKTALLERMEVTD